MRPRLGAQYTKRNIMYTKWEIFLFKIRLDNNLTLGLLTGIAFIYNFISIQWIVVQIFIIPFYLIKQTTFSNHPEIRKKSASYETIGMQNMAHREIVNFSSTPNRLICHAFLKDP